MVYDIIIYNFHWNTEHQFAIMSYINYFWWLGQKYSLDTCNNVNFYTENCKVHLILNDAKNERSTCYLWTVVTVSSTCYLWTVVTVSSTCYLWTVFSVSSTCYLWTVVTVSSTCYLYLPIFVKMHPTFHMAF